ncbi:MAG: ATPase domain-containing protein [Candidatus Micrarchaeota archaeon]
MPSKKRNKTKELAARMKQKAEVPKGTAEKIEKTQKEPKKKERCKTGIEGLDSVIEGGIPVGTLNLLSGYSGSGKATFAMQFLYYGAQNGEPGLYISLEEEVDEVIEAMEMHWPDLRKLIKEKKLVVLRPEVYRFDVLKELIEDEVEKMGAKRVVVNPFSFITAYFESTYDVRKALSQLRTIMRKRGCTALAISDVKEGERAFSASGFEEFVANGVFMLHLIAKSDQAIYVRALQIRKLDFTEHPLRLLPMEIKKEGIEVYPDAEIF